MWWLPSLALVVTLRLASLRLGRSTPEPDELNAHAASMADVPRRFVRRVVAPARLADPADGASTPDGGSEPRESRS